MAHWPCSTISIWQEAAEALLRKDLPFNYIAPIDFPPPPETVEEQVEEPAIDEAAIALARRAREAVGGSSGRTKIEK